MTRLGIVSLPVVFLLTVAGHFSVWAESPSPAPDFKEVYDLVREHLAGANDDELNRLAVQGFLTALGPRVSLAGTPAAGTTNETLLLSKSRLFDGLIGYVRINRVDDGLEKAILKAWQELGATNKLSGIVMDLRFAVGADYAAAAATADLFDRKEQALLDWGQGMVKSKEKTDSIAIPLAVLVNRQTAAAAEALAAILRQTGAGLILGNRTAGQALISQEYPLKDGERLRIATSPIQLGDGSSLSSQGVMPDIAVEVAAADERAYFVDPFRELPRTGGSAGTGSASANSAAGTNRVRRPRFNEAELVRERRDGSVPDPDIAADGGNDSDKPVVRDPALARALDFLKGVSVIRQTRS